jgi:hypothetical protein
MSLSLPSSFPDDITRLIEGLGEPATFTPASGAAPTALTVSVQSPMAVNLVGDAYQDLLLVYVSGKRLPTAPVKFDRITLRGSERTIHEAEAVMSGTTVLAWVLKVVGE